MTDYDQLRSDLHSAIQFALMEDGLLVNWFVVAEVMDGEQRHLTQIAGGGHDGLEEPTIWQRIGMSEAVISILRERLLGMYDAYHDEDEDEE